MDTIPTIHINKYYNDVTLTTHDYDILKTEKYIAVMCYGRSNYSVKLSIDELNEQLIKKDMVVLYDQNKLYDLYKLNHSNLWFGHTGTNSVLFGKFMITHYQNPSIEKIIDVNSKKFIIEISKTNNYFTMCVDLSRYMNLECIYIIGAWNGYENEIRSDIKLPYGCTLNFVSDHSVICQ